MEDLVIPGWAVAVSGGMGTLLLGWLIWLTLRTNENDKAIALNNANDINVGKEFDKVFDAIAKLDAKLDLFLAEELKFFKEHFKKS